MKVTLLGITRMRGLVPDGTAEQLIETAGRVSYNSGSLVPEGSHPNRWIEARIRQGHESVIEHASATFLIEGVSRVCSHQLVRHRLASYTQESQRYVKMRDRQTVMPASVMAEPAVFEAFVDVECRAEEAYQKALDAHVPKEDARFILPHGMQTRLVMTMNFRMWRHFLNVRCDPAAQWEIRRVAYGILEALYAEAPTCFGDLAERFLGTGASEGEP